MVGTINLDYRSLYLHFENGVFLYDCEAIKDIKADFDGLFPICQEVTEEYQERPLGGLKDRPVYPAAGGSAVIKQEQSGCSLTENRRAARVVFFKNPC